MCFFTPPDSGPPRAYAQPTAPPYPAKKQVPEWMVATVMEERQRRAMAGVAKQKQSLLSDGGFSLGTATLEEFNG